MLTLDRATIRRSSAAALMLSTSTRGQWPYGRAGNKGNENEACVSLLLNLPKTPNFSGLSGRRELVMALMALKFKFDIRI